MPPLRKHPLRGEITVVRKQSLVEPHRDLRQLSDKRVCELAAKVRVAMGCAV